MVTEFKLPELGENIETGDVINVFVSPGDIVEKDQPLMEIETDKAAIEVPAPVAGIVKGVHVKEGETIRVGQLLITIDEDRRGLEKGRAEEKQKVTETKEIEIEEKKAKIEKVKGEEEKRAEAEVRKKGLEPEEGEKTEEIEAPPEPEGKIVEFTRSPQAVAEMETSRKIVPASPSVRKLAREIGVDIAQITGSGPGGRITEEDVKNFASKKLTGVRVKTTEATEESVSLPDFGRWGEIERVPMSNVRRLTAARMSSAWRAPHVTQHDKADITELEKARKQFGKKAEEAGGKLTMTAILLKVVGSALKVFPKFNASVDMANNEIINKNYYNIAVAVDTDRGLIVPVIRNVDKKNLIELSAELTQLSEKARNKKITVEELQGGNFTISNLGGLGGTYFSPVIYSPDVGLLGISRASIEPVFLNEKFEPRLMLPLSLSYDHRLIDGADAIRFLRWIIEALEQPFKLILEG